jgi:hypothetical protein
MCRENQKTDLMFSNLFSENLTVYEIMWKNTVLARQATDDNIVQHRKGAICMPDN